MIFYKEVIDVEKRIYKIIIGQRYFIEKERYFERIPEGNSKPFVPTLKLAIAFVVFHLQPTNVRILRAPRGINKFTLRLEIQLGCHYSAAVPNVCRGF